MTPKEQKALTQAIQANRRSLSLLDKRIEDLAKTHPSLLNEYDTDDKQPFFYAVVGVDGQIGIDIETTTTSDTNPAFGYIRMNPDSAFVLTRISMAQSAQPFGPNLGTLTTRANSSIQGAPPPQFSVRFYDESSSRWITFTNQNNEPQQKATLPVEVFSPYSAFNEGGFLLPAECVFPRSGVVRVEAYVDGSMFSGYRLQVLFQGYKVYGG